MKQMPTGRMMAQIALKDIFRIMSKRLLEIELYDQMKEKMNPFDLDYRQGINRLDKRDFFSEIDRIKKILETGTNDFELMTWDKVYYKVPVAFQNALTVYGDMNPELLKLYRLARTICAK